MKPKRNDQPNYALLGCIVFSLFCWLGLLAVWADFGATGLELLRAPGMFSAVEGAILVGLNALGLLALAAVAGGGLAVLVRAAHNDGRHGRPMSRGPH